MKASLEGFVNNKRNKSIFAFIWTPTWTIQLNYACADLYAIFFFGGFFSQQKII